MSHVTNVELQIKDLGALKKAAEALGLEFRENQKTYKWFGTHVGDYPLPKGFTKHDMGHCDHALTVKGMPGAYEVGICKARNGDPGYIMQFDFWGGGYGLQNKIGKDAAKLRQEYAVAVATAKVRMKGFRVERKVTAQGKVVLRATR